MTFDDKPLELRDDEDSALPIIDAGGEYRVLGHIPPPPGRNVSARPFGAAPLVPESEWVEFDLRKTPGFADAVPVLDQNGKGACFPPGTRIRMADGTNRKIEDVRLLDSVVTAEGRTGTVVRTMVRQHGPTILKLNLWGHSHLRLTDEHPVLTKRGYVKAGELRIGDWVACQPEEARAWRRVRGIEQEEYSGPVFNLEVEGDNSYVAEGIGVHNCNGHAAASSLMAARFLSGQTPVKLSPWYVYAKLCGGIDAGSNIGDALRLLQSEGTCRFESVPYGTINPRRIPDQAEKEAAGFKIEIGRPLTTFAEMMSAAQLLRPFNFSIRVGGGFNNLDADGCPPVAFGPGNHAVCGGLGAKRMRNGKWAFLWLNSWTPGWGDGGFAWVHEGHFVHQSYFEAYDIEAAYDLSGDPLNPPIAI